MKKIVFITGVHGDEYSPVKVMDKLNVYPYLIANPQAMKIKKRYLETDLNRSFPGCLIGSYEEKLAINLLKKLKEYSAVVDLHTASCSTPPFVIITKNT